MKKEKTPIQKLAYIFDLLAQLDFLKVHWQGDRGLIIDHIDANNQLWLSYNEHEHQFELLGSLPTIISERAEQIRLTTLIEISNLLSDISYNFPENAINLFIFTEPLQVLEA